MDCANPQIAPNNSAVTVSVCESETESVTCDVSRDCCDSSVTQHTVKKRLVFMYISSAITHRLSFDSCIQNVCHCVVSHVNNSWKSAQEAKQETNSPKFRSRSSTGRDRIFGQSASANCYRGVRSLFFFIYYFIFYYSYPNNSVT